MSMPDPRRTSAAYRRDLWLACQVIGQLRDQTLEGKVRVNSHVRDKLDG